MTRKTPNFAMRKKLKIVNITGQDFKKNINFTNFCHFFHEIKTLQYGFN